MTESRIVPVIPPDEARFHLLAETMPQKIFTARPNGDIDYFNRQWTAFTGLSFQQIRDWGWTQFIHPEDVAENLRLWRHSIATGEPIEFEHRFRRADGVYRWHLSRAVPLRDPDGHVVMWIGSNTDIDDQKRAAEEISRARAEAEAERVQLHNLLMQAPAIICVLRGPEHVFELANPLYLQLVDHRDITGKRAREALPELEGQGFFELLDTVYATGETFIGAEAPAAIERERGIREEGYFNFVYQALRSTTGEVQGILVHAVEVTDQVRARHEVERLAAQQTAMLSQMTDGIVVADRTGRTTYMNEAAERIYGASMVGVPVEAYASTGGLLTLESEPYRSKDSPLARAALGGETVVNAKVRVCRPDGVERILQRDATPIVGADGSSLGAVMVVQDVTEQHEMEQQKDAFLSAAAHDLKTPLATIKGQAQLLQRRAARTQLLDSARVIEGLAQIDATVTRMNRFINELLDATHGEMDRPLELRTAPVDLVKVARTVVSEFQQMTDGYRISVEAPLSTVIGTWDAERLERVLANLLSNALKYSPQGGQVTLTVGIEQEGDDTWATLAVRDQGMGIPPADLPHIFGRFYRAANIEHEIPGTGIGLASVKQIIEQHKGSIIVDSQDGQGTTFIVRLPMEPVGSGQRATGK